MSSFFVQALGQFLNLSSLSIVSVAPKEVAMVSMRKLTSTAGANTATASAAVANATYDALPNIVFTCLGLLEKLDEMPE